MAEVNYYQKGVEEVDRGNWVAALAMFEKAIQMADEPECRSYLAACMAKERGQFNKAASTCREIIDIEPENPVHYLNLGRIYSFQGRKPEALEVFRQGLRHGRDIRIIAELEKLGTRKKPVIPFLSRNNVINKYLGIILKRLRVR